MRRITIIGAGLAGTLMALYLARRGYEVDLYESRSDIRVSELDHGRSINLALSCRGITGLQGVGLLEQINKIMVPMRARAIHEEHGPIKYQAFGRHHDEYIKAIKRTELNALLLDETEKYPQISLHFNVKLLHFDMYKKQLHFEARNGSRFTKSYDQLIGADGAASQIREALTKESLITSTRTFLPHGYKELSISSNFPEKLVREHLHLWPRESFMLLGNPNRDNSITGSLFMPHEGKNSFSELNSEVKIKKFFKKTFSDAFDAMPDLVGEFLNNPTGNMSTIKTSPWYFEDSCLLIGDAAHGIIPFFGQGMNCAFEDCRILNDLLQYFQDDWSKVMPAFYHSRKINTDAVAQMSMDNYHEIQSDIRDDKFNLRKQLEQELMHRYPDRYISKHVMVMFTNSPYAQALVCGQIQAQLLKEISKEARCVEDINWLKTDLLMNDYDKKLANLQIY